MSSKKDSTEKSVMKLDLYGLLNIPEDATPKQVKKAYRIKALECHPDKNPDNPKAAELFHQLSEALKILTDIGARAAYDHLRKARKAAQERSEKLDAQRKKVKLDLEARERAAEKVEKQAKRTLLQEIERLRDESCKILEEEQRKMREQMKEEKRLVELAKKNVTTPAQLRVKWKSSKDDPTNGGYDEEVLMKIFLKYGEVSTLLLSKKKKGTAIIEFSDGNIARLAVEMELGIPTNPLKISWLSGKPESPTSSNFIHCQPQDGDSGIFRTSQSASPSSSAPSHDNDFESAVLNRLKREQERRRTLADDLAKDEPC